MSNKGAQVYIADVMATITAYASARSDEEFYLTATRLFCQLRDELLSDNRLQIGVTDEGNGPVMCLDDGNDYLLHAGLN